jgi:hypothetical protein
MAVTINGSAGVTTNAGGSVNPSTNVDGINYSCRAWVSFNGTGTVAIRGSGNVSSITDNGTGDYTVNFTTAMTDANYAFNGTTQNYSTTVGTAPNVVAASLNASPTASAFRLEVKFGGGGVTDLPYVSVSIFR